MEGAMSLDMFSDQVEKFKRQSIQMIIDVIEIKR